MERWIVKSEAGRGARQSEGVNRDSKGQKNGEISAPLRLSTLLPRRRRDRRGNIWWKMRVWGRGQIWGGELSHKRNLWIWGAVLKDALWKEEYGGMRAYTQRGYLEGI